VKYERSNFAQSSRAMKWLIALCLLLVLLSVAVQAFHIHPDGSNDELKNCPFCHVATATALAVLVVFFLAVQRATSFVACSEDADAIASFDVFTLFSRPPPLA